MSVGGCRALNNSPGAKPSESEERIAPNDKEPAKPVLSGLTYTGTLPVSITSFFDY